MKGSICNYNYDTYDFNFGELIKTLALSKADQFA